MTIYSYSRLKCFQQCPQKYKFQYIDWIKISQEETVELFLGKRVHETLEKLYKDLQFQEKNTLEDLLEFLQYEWRKNWDDSIKIVNTKISPEDYLSMAMQFITHYYQQYRPFNHEKTIAVEKHIIVDLDGGDEYKLCCYIDRVAKTDRGWYQIHDYKTCSRLPSTRNIQSDKQLTLYALCLKERYPYIKNIQLIWHFLRFNMNIVSTLSDREINELKQNTINLIDEIESNEQFPRNQSRLCDWCRFKNICD
ncbi:hypothetical protein B6U98_04095 [Thermoplasmatales archaeon ex4572_165]|nr:MAG: hypothetical protein B6U98_04095 [Thermoplasmatales archaeon ex4572_165]RLF58690.1 MAG: hypothetical protein DRN27_04685 [Thermoplasmata archaeon]